MFRWIISCIVFAFTSTVSLADSVPTDTANLSKKEVKRVIKEQVDMLNANFYGEIMDTRATRVLFETEADYLRFKPFLTDSMLAAGYLPATTDVFKQLVASSFSGKIQSFKALCGSRSCAAKVKLVPEFDPESYGFCDEHKDKFKSCRVYQYDPMLEIGDDTRRFRQISCARIINRAIGLAQGKSEVNCPLISPELLENSQFQHALSQLQNCRDEACLNEIKETFKSVPDLSNVDWQIEVRLAERITEQLQVFPFKSVTILSGKSLETKLRETLIHQLEKYNASNNAQAAIEQIACEGERCKVAIKDSRHAVFVGGEFSHFDRVLDIADICSTLYGSSPFSQELSANIYHEIFKQPTHAFWHTQYFECGLSAEYSQYLLAK